MQRLLCFLGIAIATGWMPAMAVADDTLPAPLDLDAVLRRARTHRQEIVAARARTRAAAERPAIVSKLEDPMIMPSIAHLPFMLDGVDANLMVEQRFPLSRLRGRRRAAAEAETLVWRAASEGVGQGVQHEAALAFFMLRERRTMARVLTEQIGLAREFVTAAGARYGAGVGNQSEVLRAEIEVARLEGAAKVLEAEIEAAEAMLNASLARPAEAPVPELHEPILVEPAAWTEVRDEALSRRPELAAGRAELRRTRAETAVMRSMYAPMGLVRTGPAYTMTDGWGWMLTVGISVPLFRGRLAAGVREAKAMSAMAEADLAAMQRMIEGEAASARSGFIAARRRVAVLRDEVLPRAERAIDPSLAGYASGTLPLVSVIDAAQTLWSVQAEIVDAEYELGVAWSRLQRARGAFDRGGDDDED